MDKWLISAVDGKGSQSVSTSNIRADGSKKWKPTELWVMMAASKVATNLITLSCPGDKSTCQDGFIPRLLHNVA